MSTEVILLINKQTDNKQNVESLSVKQTHKQTKSRLNLHPIAQLHHNKNRVTFQSDTVSFHSQRRGCDDKEIRMRSEVGKVKEQRSRGRNSAGFLARCRRLPHTTELTGIQVCSQFNLA